MSIFSEEKSNIGGIWTTAMKLYKKSFIHILPLGIIAGIALTFSSVLKKPLDLDIENFSFNPVDTLVPLLLSLATLYLTSLFVVKFYNFGNGEEVNWKKAFTNVTKRYHLVVVSCLLAICLDALGFIALIVPGIFLFVLLLMVQPLVLLDNNGIIESIKNSAKLVWGNWWHSFSIIGPLMFMSFILGYFSNNVITKQNWSMLGINIIVASLYYPFFYASIVALFSDLKIRLKLELEAAVLENSSKE